MKVFVTGLASLHWVRLEYGNIGNYYIIAPLFRMLHKMFEGAEISTTFQLTPSFYKSYNLTVLPLDYYYAWSGDDLNQALKEYAAAEIFSSTGALPETEIPYIETVLSSDIIIDVSGDMWGDNCEGMGDNRFLVELLKIRTAQLLNKPVVLFASSPGPVTESQWVAFAKKVYAEYTLVANRENTSKQVMEKSGFDISNTQSYACPAFLFDSSYYPYLVDADALCNEAGFSPERLNIGIVLAAYSFSGHSFEIWKREDKDFLPFAKLIEHIIGKKNQNVILLAHSGGFELPPNFKRIPWRDHKMQSRLYEVVEKRGSADLRYLTINDRIYDPWEIHALIGKFDILVSGRVHGAVAGLSQYVPTLAIDYKNGPLAHKTRGFFELAGMEKHVIPRDDLDFTEHFDNLFDNRQTVKKQLQTAIPKIRKKSLESFEILASLVNMRENNIL
jgi:colanic acid/amylovoran biosynthesis protein